MDLNKRSQEMNEFFNRVVDIDYDTKHMEFIKGKERVTDLLPTGVKEIIDLGAGTGLELIKLYKVYPEVHTLAIDVSDGMLKKLKERNISNNIEIVNKSFFDYSFKNNFYDAVISTQALHHFEPSDKVVLYKKVYDALKDNGVFIIEDYFVNDDEAERKGFDDYKKLARGEGKHYDTPLTMEHEIEVLKEAGFNKIEKDVTDDYRILISTK